MDKILISLGNFFFKNRSFLPLFLFVLLPFFIQKEHIYEDNIFFASVLLCFLGSVIRIITTGYAIEGTSGRNRKEQIAEYLNVTGMYSMCRNPLYIGNLFVWMGLAVFTYSIIFLNIIVIFFLIFYYPIVYVEEKFLKNRFGEKYIQWKNRVPRFQFAFWYFQKSDFVFNLKRCLKNEYSGIMSISFTYLLIYTIRNYLNKTLIFDSFYLVFLIIIILCYIVRFFKKNTSLLN